MNAYNNKMPSLAPINTRPMRHSMPTLGPISKHNQINLQKSRSSRQKRDRFIEEKGDTPTQSGFIPENRDNQPQTCSNHSIDHILNTPSNKLFNPKTATPEVNGFRPEPDANGLNLGQNMRHNDFRPGIGLLAGGGVEAGVGAGVGAGPSSNYYQPDQANTTGFGRSISSLQMPGTTMSHGMTNSSFNFDTSSLKDSSMASLLNIISSSQRQGHSSENIEKFLQTLDPNQSSFDRIMQAKQLQLQVELQAEKINKSQGLSFRAGQKSGGLNSVSNLMSMDNGMGSLTNNSTEQRYRDFQRMGQDDDLME